MYWHDLLKKIEDGIFDPTFILTHRVKIDEMKELYSAFDKKEYGVVKVCFFSPSCPIWEILVADRIVDFRGDKILGTAKCRHTPIG